MSATLTQQQLKQQQQQQQQQKQTRTSDHLKDMTPRLVPSGKVYRQLFEAQVQLSEAYEKVKEKYREHPPQVRVTEDNIPLVKEGRAVRGNGILTTGEQEWINANPNEIYSHNPVYEKYKSDEKKAQAAKVKRRAEKTLVAELPDTVVPASIGSDVEARIERSRKKKHEIVWEDMLHEIALTNMNLEPAVKKASRAVLVQLAEDDKALDDLLDQLNNEDAVVNSTNERFEQIKSELLAHSDKRQEFIEQMDQAFAQIEKERVESIRSIINKYSEELFRINYHPRPEIERLLDAEIQLLNNHILINKSCYAQLYAKLLTADIEREKNQMAFIESKVFTWQDNRLIFEIKRLEDFIQNLDMLNPRNEPNPKYFEEELQAKQKLINQNRLGLVDALKSLRPPESTKTAIHKWYNSLNDHSKNLDELNINYIAGLRSNYEESNQKILSEIQSKMKSLIEAKIVNESQSKEIMEYKFLPLWSRKQREIEQFIDQTEAHFEELSQVTSAQFSSLFKFLQGLTHIWDMHELGLVKKERQLQDLLQECRQENDTQNQKREEKLDSILDQMRESSSEKDLKRLLSNVSMQLEAIKRGYETFHDAQIEIVRNYPEMVVDELKKYKNALYKFFSIKHVASSESAETGASSNPENGENSESAEPVVDIVKILEDMQDSLKEVLTTSTGAKYYITQQPLSTEQQQPSEAVDGSDTESSNDILGYDELIPNTKPEFARKMQFESHLKNTFISADQLIEAKKLVRLNFLNHLERWLEDANVRSSAIVSVKTEEIAKELELRVHLHEPRMKRAEMDVHNVRATELIMHDERVDRHCKGIEEAIKNMEKKFLSMQTYLNELAAQHRSDVLNLEIGFNNASKSIRLLALQDQLSRQRDKHMDCVKMTLRNFRSKFDETLAYLRNSNAKFRSSFNIFSDGGNFSADEIETYKKKLEKMANLIDKNETNMLKDMEKLEKKQLDEAIKLMSQFQEKFKYHLVDLQFIEKISRWLNDTQIKIKTQVSASNAQAKRLSKFIVELDKRLDACERPNLDKMTVKPNDLLEFFDEINELIYERAALLKCFADTDTVPLKFRAKLPTDQTQHKSEQAVIQGNPAHSLPTASKSHSESPGSMTAESSSNNHHHQQHHQGTESSGEASSTQPVSTKGKPATDQNLTDSSSMLKSSSKVISEDSALVIMRTILNNTRELNEPIDKSSLQKSELSFNPDGKHSKSSKGSKKNSKNKSAPKLSLSNSSSSPFASELLLDEETHL